jgi:hypothetical protein
MFTKIGLKGKPGKEEIKDENHPNWNDGSREDCCREKTGRGDEHSFPRFG